MNVFKLVVLFINEKRFMFKMYMLDEWGGG